MIASLLALYLAVDAYGAAGETAAVRQARRKMVAALADCVRALVAANNGAGPVVAGVDKDPKGICSNDTLPIGEAPVVAGQPFGPVLLFVRDGRGWITGWWSGAEWCDDNGLLIEPVAFGYLPPDPPIEVC